MAPPEYTSDICLLLNLSTSKGWKAELAWLADLQRTVYPTHQLQVKRMTGQVRRQRPTFYPLWYATNRARERRERAKRRSGDGKLRWKSVETRIGPTSRRPTCQNSADIMLVQTSFIFPPAGLTLRNLIAVNINRTCMPIVNQEFHWFDGAWPNGHPLKTPLTGTALLLS